jgi:spore coat polysaccharide biosynthesis protein SpsF (cytidylyltransferase family)
MRAHRAELRCVELEVDDLFRTPGLRLQVDEPADLELARAVWRRFGGPGGRGGPGGPGGERVFALRDVIAWLAERPEVRALNRGVEESAANRRLRRLDREHAPNAASIVGRWP